MEKVTSFSDFRQKNNINSKSFLLLYKSGSEQSECAYQNLDKSLENQTEISVFTADVSTVRDIHTEYNITSVPSLLIFENQNLTSVLKGCHEENFFKALTENAIFQAKAQKEGKLLKRVTVYSTPTCSWCNTLKTWLRKNNIPFTDIDISKNQSAADELVNRSGQQGVPQTDINGQIVVGFDKTKLSQLLEIA